METLRRVWIMVAATIDDELHHKSVYLLGACAVLFVLLLRGCFDNDVVVNGQRLDGVTIGYHASLVAFHLIAMAGVLIAILLGMRVFTRDNANGSTVAFFTRPVRRIEYLAAKIAGVWITAYGLTLLLHCTVYGIMLFKTGGRIGSFIPASFIVSLNVLFAVVMVMLLSRLLPDTVAALLCMAVWIVGYVNDSLIAASQHAVVRNVLEQMQQTEQAPALWRTLWPKMTGLQYYAVSLIRNEPFRIPGMFHPLINVVGLTLLLFLLLWWHVHRHDPGAGV